MGRFKYLLIAGVLILTAGCATEAETTTTTGAVDTTSTTESVTTTTAESTTTTAGETTTTTSTTTTVTTIPGEPIDFGPMEGDVLMVIGVAHDDVLNLRELPGPSFDIIDTIPPDYMELVALGNTRDIGPAFWIEVEYEGTVGWVHMGFVGFEGITDDMTAFVVDELGERPTAESLSELGLIVAEVFASEEPESDLVMVAPESVGDLGEVTYDVIGLGDDAVLGMRVHVFADEVSDGFSLHTVEVTTICGRGVDDEGLCT